MGLSLQGRVSRTKLMSITTPNRDTTANGRSDTTGGSNQRSMDHENETRISLWHGSRYRNTASGSSAKGLHPKHLRVVRNASAGNDSRLSEPGIKDRCTGADRVDVMGVGRLAYPHALRPVVRVDRKKAKGGVMEGYIASIITAAILVCLSLR